MTVQQLSVFIENKAGTLLKVLELLKEAKIQLIASTIADTVEYGIYRIICSEPMRAYNTLKEANISVALSDVFALTLDNRLLFHNAGRAAHDLGNGSGSLRAAGCALVAGTPSMTTAFA